MHFNVKFDFLIMFFYFFFLYICMSVCVDGRGIIKALSVFPFYLLQLPAQMGSLLGSSLALQYLDCVQDESALLRLNFWLGYVLHEGK